MKQYNVVWYKKVEDVVDADCIESAEKVAHSFIGIKNKHDKLFDPASSMLFSVEEVADEVSDVS